MRTPSAAALPTPATPAVSRLAACAALAIAAAALAWPRAAGAQAEVLRCVDGAGRITYSNAGCPAGSRHVSEVPILASPPASDMADPPPARASMPPVPTPAAPSGPGLAIIGNDRQPTPAPAPAPAPLPVEAWAPDPYAGGWGPGWVPPPRPEPRPPVVHDPGPGHRPCQNLAGIRRYNC